jgi:hypothetical protein
MFLLLWLAVVSEPCVVGAAGVCSPGQFCRASFDPSDGSCPATGACAPLPSVPGEITLALPVPAGDRVFCIKGPLQPDRDTHSTCSDDRRFALDLASSAFEAPHVVVAAADGVAFGWGDCPSPDLNNAPPDQTCNLGLGNVVRVQHAGGVFTQYAHLSAIVIVPGQAVKRGDPLGIEGNSGSAGARHLHFSLHLGDASRLEPAPSLPIRRLRSAGGKILDTLTLHCGELSANGGLAPQIAYVSDTTVIARPPQIGFQPPARLALEVAVGAIFDPATRPRAEIVLRATAAEPLARYWLAVAQDLDGDREAARGAFLALATGRIGPEWIRRWSWLRLADIAAALGRGSEARRALETATRGAPTSDLEFGRFADRVRRDVDALSTRR